MGVFKINITNPIIDLIADLGEAHNSCQSLYEFSIKSIPMAAITINAIRISGEQYAYDTLEIQNLTGSWSPIHNSLPYDFIMGDSGVKKIRLSIGNSPNQNFDFADGGEMIVAEGGYACNVVEIAVNDSTNGKTENRIFSRCDNSPRCISNYTPPPPALNIDNTTNIFIYGDNSGSMDLTLDQLLIMRDTLLKDALLPYYNNDSVLYDSKVKFIQEPSERLLKMLDIMSQSPTGKIISLVFMDEAQPIYTGQSTWSINSPRTLDFDADMSALRTRLDAYAVNRYRAVTFQVTGKALVIDNFKSLVKALEYGSGSYSGNNGLAGRNEFNYKYDITNGGTPEYYKNLIITSLEELGFTI